MGYFKPQFAHRVSQRIAGRGAMGDLGMTSIGATDSFAQANQSAKNTVNTQANNWKAQVDGAISALDGLRKDATTLQSLALQGSPSASGSFGAANQVIATAGAAVTSAKAAIDTLFGQISTMASLDQANQIFVGKDWVFLLNNDFPRAKTTIEGALGQVQSSGLLSAASKAQADVVQAQFEVKQAAQDAQARQAAAAPPPAPDVQIYGGSTSTTTTTTPGFDMKAYMDEMMRVYMAPPPAPTYTPTPTYSSPPPALPYSGDSYSSPPSMPYPTQGSTTTIYSSNTTIPTGYVVDPLTGQLVLLDDLYAQLAALERELANMDATTGPELISYGPNYKPASAPLGMPSFFAAESGQANSPGGRTEMFGVHGMGNPDVASAIATRRAQIQDQISRIRDAIAGAAGGSSPAPAPASGGFLSTLSPTQKALGGIAVALAAYLAFKKFKKGR